MAKTIEISKIAEDPTLADMSAPVPKRRTGGPTKKDLQKKYMLLIDPEQFEDVNAIVMYRDHNRRKTGGKAYSMNQLIVSLLDDYLKGEETQEELKKARKFMKS